MRNLDAQISELRTIFQILDDPVALARFAASIEDRKQRAREKRLHRWEEMAAHITPAQIAQVNALRALGAKSARLYQDRESRNVAVMMQRQPVFDATRSRMGCKLYMIYPDGSRVETFERSISLRDSF